MSNKREYCSCRKETCLKCYTLACPTTEGDKTAAQSRMIDELTAPVEVDANELAGVRARLKSGDYDGADIMRAWLAIDRLLAQKPAAHPAITHCDNCGCDWLDNGLNPIGCPYCKQPASVDEGAKCSCPSGDGSLRWPCRVHPPEQQPAACDMGALCIGCEPRNADGSCPGQQQGGAA